MELPIPKKLKKLWDVWDIPTCILLSLFLQVFLVLFASFRQRSKNSFLRFLIWSAYLSADWIAAVTVGLITKVLTEPFHDPHVNEDLYAFWASFLLLHLGGPDTITSFALEDNEFWLRHLFGLILQVMGAGYCIFLKLSNNNLLLPTILVFVVGSVKYAERTMALYLASLDQFEDTVGDFEDPNAQPETMALYFASPDQFEDTVGDVKDPNAQPEREMVTKYDFNLASEPNHMELLTVSYSLLKSFKGIILGYALSSKLVESSTKLFLQIKDPNVGFKLIEYQLSFMYDVFHTKAAAVRSRIGLIFRLSSFCFIVGAFILFHFLVNKDESGGFEMSLTYAMLIGAVALDTISGIKLMLLSDWILVSKNGLIKRWRELIPEYVWKRRRWCESISLYNMIDYCLDERWLWKHNLPDCVRVMVDNIKIMLSSSSTDNIVDLKRFIFENGEKLHEHPRNWRSQFFGYDGRMKFIELDVEYRYKEQVLQLHLLTEICYHRTQTESSKYTEEEKRSRRICKVISDYMFYLLIMKPDILGPSVMGINWQNTFRKTFEEAKRYLIKHQVSDHVKACNELIDYDVKEKDRSENVLSLACLSAKYSMQEEDSWKRLSYEWLVGLCFGALSNRPMLQAEQVSKGGELLTFIWFLLHHLVSPPSFRRG